MTVPWHEMTALALGGAIDSGEIDPVALTEHYLARIADADKDHTVYIRATPERAQAEATAAAARAKAGVRRSPLDGVPISWKDLYDTAGITTTGGSPLLKDRVPLADAKVLARAARAGLVCLGKTTMTELAYSGLGINPSMGTPINPFDSQTARAPGGSSSGAASSVARGLAAAGIGSDTGGSVRIPAAWHGLVGLKTSVGAIPLEGVLPLWPGVDTVGPLTHNVADAAALFAILAARPAADLAGAKLDGCRLLVADNFFWEDLEDGVDNVTGAAVKSLEAAGAVVVQQHIDALDGLIALGMGVASMMSSDAYAVWGETLESNPDVVYRPVLERFRMGCDQDAVEMMRIKRRLAELATAYLDETTGFDAVLAPTTPITPPPLDPLIGGGDLYLKTNMAALRNTRVGNVFNLTALTVPCGESDGLPVGLMLMTEPGRENAILRLGAAVESALAHAIS